MKMADLKEKAAENVAENTHQDSGDKNEESEDAAELDDLLDSKCNTNISRWNVWP